MSGYKAENCKSYSCEVNDKPASIAVNMELAGSAPVRSKPLLLWVWVQLKSPTTEGLADQSELAAINDMENELTSRLLSACDAVYAGRITTEGRQEFYFYSGSEERFLISTDAAMGRFPQYEIEQGTHHDLDWNHYFDVLYPSGQDIEHVKNQSVIEILTDYGDTLDSVRDVRHFIYFKQSQDRSRFASRAQALDYQVVCESEYPEGEYPLGLIIMRDQGVTQDIMDTAVIELIDLAEEIGGNYDGWETEIVSSMN